MRGKREEQLCRHQDEEGGGGLGVRAEDPCSLWRRAEESKLPSLSPWGAMVETSTLIHSAASGEPVPQQCKP